MSDREVYAQRRRELAILLDAVRRLEVDVVDHAGQVDYDTRNELVLRAAGTAAAAGVPVGIRLDAAEPEWPVIYFELPGAGQVSWHVPQHGRGWDGHDGVLKWARIENFARLEGVPDVR